MLISAQITESDISIRHVVVTQDALPDTSFDDLYSCIIGQLSSLHYRVLGLWDETQAGRS